MLTRRTYTQDLEAIAQEGITKEEENDRFRVFLKQQDGPLVDAAVHRLNQEVSAAVDCTQCGNCCRSLMINIEPPEAEALSAHLQIPLATLKENYIEESQQGQMVMKSIPCAFLSNSKCSIYEHRFHECREFPHLHKPGFTRRLFGTLMHYARCPIIYNVIEALKQELPVLQEDIL